MAKVTRMAVCCVILFVIFSGHHQPLTMADPARGGDPFFEPGAGDVIYVYDELGRLVAVIDPAGDTAIYNYDAVGNLVSITRHGSSTAAVIEFTPNGGAVGASVTIYGTGFSATPSQNTVTFNGTAATVTSSTSTQIVTTVPSGATTGAISVTSPAGSATSATSFVVSPANGAPTITGFSPSIATPGTAVTITGTNFETVASNNKATFNIVNSAVSSSNATSIATTTPVAGAGKISVTTPGGKATSPNNFFIVPSPYTASEVDTTGRMSIGATSSVSINSANKIALMLFDGAAGQRVCLKMNSASFADSKLSIYNSDGSFLVNAASMSPSGGFVDTRVLPFTGTYTILIDPTGPYTGSTTLNLYDVPVDVAGTITPGGSAATVSMSVGQNARLTFSGTTNQRVSLNMTGVTIPSGINVVIYRPDGGTLASTTAFTSGGFIDTLSLPATGTYTIFIDPSVANSGSMTLTLYNVTDTSGTITPGGSAVTVTTTVPGQNGELTFSGTSGQRICLNLTSVSISASFVTVKNPDGTNLIASTYVPSPTFFDTRTLGATGTYKIILDPNTSYTGSMTFTLYDVASDITGTITPGGSAVTVTTTTAGQNATLTFSGTAGQKVSLVVSSVTISNSGVVIKKPDGTTLVSTSIGTGGGFIDAQTLPVTGTYTISIDPTLIATGSMTLTLHDCPDVTGTITIGGSAVNVTASVPGQNGTLTFSGTSSQQVTVRMTSNTMNCVTVVLYKPDNSLLTYAFSCTGSFNLATQTLPTTGTYKIVIDPNAASTGSISVSVTNP